MCEDREDDSSATFTSLPSFGRPPKLYSIPHTVSPQHSTSETEEDATNDDFEFSLMISDAETHPPITADEIFSDGHIRPIYPAIAKTPCAFKEKPRRPQLIQLLMEESNWSISEASSSFVDELEGVTPGTYCLWPQDRSQGSFHKCCSTQSLFRWWIRDPGFRRSNSDGRKIVFLAAEERKRSTEKVDADGGKKKGKGGEKKGKDMGMITAHQLYYGKTDRAGSRKSYLPYKTEIGVFFQSAG
ncbi:uncharacterized protein LOC110038618 [Phalaenopsis equestris]|uniref:uncharacterized protein LOC110038618 n=1 Tax=Phalaenopsis equestris TaxID=78828 RepID=UPI0009E57AD1|nr:uncharacterized protein LOC110038618 [Phalaenopsis equestris]